MKFINMRKRSCDVQLGWIYLACLGLSAIVTHLASEFVGMGEDADAIVFSPHHAYLGIAALLCGAFVISELRKIVRSSDGFRDLRRMLNDGIARLPFGGRWPLYVLTAVIALGLGLGTAIGEGCYFCGHDFIAGVAGAVLAAILLALVARVLTARLPKLAADFAAMLPVPDSDPPLRRARELARRFRSPRFEFWSTHIANRPPPVPNTI